MTKYTIRVGVLCTLVFKCAVAGAQETPEAAVARVWREYVDSKHGQLSSSAGAPSTLWLASEQAKWPMYDLAGFYVPRGAVAQPPSIRPTGAPGGREYEVVTQFRSSDPAQPGSASSTVLTVTVYAVRDGDRWVLANALPRKTATWHRHTVGQITYFVEPGIRFDSVRAHRAVAFIDSLASAFDVPRLGPLDYYVASSVDMAMEILGVQTGMKYGPHGGFSKPVNHQLFSGMPSLGENYRHELAHLVVLPLLQASLPTIIASEGMATWLGGTEGDDFKGSVQAVRRFLAANPAVTLDSILDSGATNQSVRYTAGAVLCAMLFERGGTAALKEFLTAGPGTGDLRAALSRLLQRPWPVIVTDWRRQVDQVANSARIQPGN